MKYNKILSAVMGIGIKTHLVIIIVRDISIKIRYIEDSIFICIINYTFVISL
jgi:hypothetical protein